MSESSSVVEAGAAGVDSHDVSRALEERYDRILRENGPAMRRVAAIYEADPARREDLFQEVCLALWQALPRFRGDCSERRSEEHTSELQSQSNLVCRLLLEKK